MSSQKAYIRTSEMHAATIKTIEKASTTLKLDKAIDNGDLIVENERLRTTIMVLQTKLNDLLDSETEMNSFKKKNRELTI